MWGKWQKWHSASDLANWEKDVATVTLRKNAGCSVKEKKTSFLWHVEFESYSWRCPNKNVQKKKFDIWAWNSRKSLRIEVGVTGIDDDWENSDLTRQTCYPSWHLNGNYNIKFEDRNPPATINKKSKKDDQQISSFSTCFWKCIDGWSKGTNCGSEHLTESVMGDGQ